jgi:hypothetical protein
MPYQYSSNPLYVAEGDILQFRYEAPPFWDYTETVTIQIGGLTTYWYITTVPEDFQPDPFPLTSITEAELSTMYTIDPVVFNSPAGPSETVTGLTPTTQAALSLSVNFIGDVNSYSLRVNDGSWFIPGGSQTVQNGDKVAVRMLTGPNNLESRELTLGIGLGFETWRITNIAIPQNAPEPFPNFTDLTAQRLNAPVYSNILRIQGLLRPGIVQVDSPAEFAISNTNTTTTNDDGFDVLSGATFGTTGTITNGQYLQLRLTTPNTEFTPTTVGLSIGDVSGGSDWVVATGASLSTTPVSFVFPDITDALEDSLIASATRPLGGITGLGTGISVPVELVSTTASEVKVKINNGSIGVFPATVTNGDTITLYTRSSASFSGIVDTTIRVGSTNIPTWRVQTNSGPDTDASFTPPTNKTNQVPSTFVSSSVVTVSGINRPITISATNGALISIDYDTAVASPRTFNPLVNSTFYLVLQSSTQLNTPVSTTVTVGTGTSNNPFTWSVSTYAVAPPPPSYVSSWYSKKNEKITRDGGGTITAVQKTKYDGYSIGTILPVLKESAASGYGDLDGSLTSRIPGYIECDGRTLNAADYPLLWEVIGNTYGGTASYNSETKAYSGTFNVPDYRNRRLCGTGLVDGNRGSSAFLPVDGGSVFSVGVTGGYWFVDTVGVAGPLPYEQVEAASNTATTGTESPFFVLGTVRTTGANLVTTDVAFNVNGTISAQVGPVSLVSTSAPPHSHIALTAVVDGDRGDPLIPWGARSMFATQAGPIDTGNNYAGEFPDESEATNAPGVWRQFLNERFPEMASELTAAGTSMSELTSQLTREGDTRIQYENIWPSAYGSLDTARLRTLNSSGTVLVAGVIDTNPSTFRIDDFVSTSGSTETHSHYITTSPITNPLTDYSYGNSSGSGTKNGLGDAANTLSISFNASQVALGLNDGTFTMNSTIKNPVPEVTLSPNRTVPILAPFHKVKYIIKAY